ncbi:MerR family transcriptional regulator [Acidomonas methanolica]|uniref:MerR family transcriptional regulator n=1 Tax=Acidomonas methanolica TaxID=437 RepID=UPI00211A35A0|nr:MerR family transcriptional regulator [Acidomonas methanolica]MCQ9154779.1 MerR family transcriptional regulator [Acidomonas methanolica]
MNRLMAIGEMARAYGISVRSLRHIEACGLITPSRSEAGRRYYGHKDVTRLGRILLLRRAGFTLRQIAAMTASLPPDPLALLDAQIALLEAQQARLATTLGELRSARRLAGIGHDLDLDSLCHLIKEGQSFMERKVMQPVLDRYFTPEDQRRWKEAGDVLFPPDAQTDYAARWRDLIARVEAALARGVAPDDAEGQDLCREWLQLLEVLEKIMGSETVAKTGRMYAEMEDWQTPERRAPFSPAVRDFIAAAARAGRGGQGGAER